MSSICFGFLQPKLFDEAGEKALDRTRVFYHQQLGSFSPLSP